MSERTCGTCWYFLRSPASKTGNCVVDPPHVLTSMQTSAVGLAGPVTQPVVHGIDPPTHEKRRGCRHWMAGTDEPASAVIDVFSTRN